MSEHGKGYVRGTGPTPTTPPPPKASATHTIDTTSVHTPKDVPRRTVIRANGRLAMLWWGPCDCCAQEWLLRVPGGRDHGTMWRELRDAPDFQVIRWGGPDGIVWPDLPETGDPHPAPAAGILNDMTDTVPVPRDLIQQAILALDHNGAVEAANALNTLLAPPQPTLPDPRETLIRDLTVALCSDENSTCQKCRMDVCNDVLPVVEAAVSAAADEAWNAGAIAAAHSIDPGYLSAMSYERVMSAIWSIRRPTEGSAT